ncbi:MAG: hypothetical protein ACLFWM_08825, partial [Actinomycetota bacterium]
GHTWAMGAGCATFLMRTGVHGLAGAGLADLVASAGLLLVVVELGSASLEGRSVPISAPASVARSLLVGGGGAGAVLVVAVLEPVGWEVGAVVGLAAALVAALIVVALARRREP